MLEAPHAVQDVELLPAFGEVDFAVNQVWVAKMDKGQVLKNETPARKRKGCHHQNTTKVEPKSKVEKLTLALPHPQFTIGSDCQGRGSHALTGMGCTEAPHQPEQLCTL